MSVEFKIDGKTIIAENGETILQAAARNGIAIPSLCRNQKISHTTSCFVCVVKDCKTGRFLPSCSACPANGQEIESDTAEVFDMRQTALNLLLSEHTGDCEAPCTVACPAHADVEEYVQAGKRGDFLESLKIIKKRIPLPMTIGRVCPRFCEKNCRKNITGSPVAINDFKRLAADMYYDSYMEDIAPETGKKVAIVGAGPAGTSAAYFLRLKGIDVTLFEAMPAAGGMTRYGIPEYRLPKAILDRELAHFEKMGIKFVFGKKLGENLTLAELEKDFDAVTLTIGCWKGSSMRCEGEEFVTQGIEFLRKVALNNASGNNPGKVIVVGGGNTAMDCVRTAVRLGSTDVNCFYRRTEAEMPAEKLEIHEAKEEGVKFTFLVAPVKVEKRSDKLVMTCQKMELGEPDASGRRKPVVIPGSDFEVEADTIIGAIGQGTLAPAGLEVDKRGNLSARVSEKVFAAGDCVSGAATVVEAVGAARLMAEDMAEYLLNAKEEVPHPIFVSRGHWASMKQDDIVYVNPDCSEAPRVAMDNISLDKRTSTFEEVSRTLSQEAMQKEGERCIQCSCSAKSDCFLRKHAQTYKCDPDAIRGEKIPASYDNRHPVIIQDRGKCIKCGTCVKVCKEVINQNLLSTKKRGFFTTVGTAFDKGFPNSCKDCLACVNECPVGALDIKKK